jgi:hypothetical protein
MREISAQKETRVLIAQKFGCKIFPEPEQHEIHGEEVTSELEVGPKADHAASAVETRASLQHKPSLAKKEIGDGHVGSTPLSKSEEVRKEFDADRERSLEELKKRAIEFFYCHVCSGSFLTSGRFGGEEVWSRPDGDNQDLAWRLHHSVRALG